VEGISGDDPFQELAATVMDAAAQFERRMIGARTKAALAEKRTRGERISGRLPFGFRLADDGKHLEADPVETGILERIHSLRAEGLGGRRIAAVLTMEGHTPRGKRWDPASVQRLADLAAAV
jgi:DNA invertase Pin-like site-specific DNA recombinase